MEQLPVLPTLRAEAEQHNSYLKKCLEQGVTGNKVPLTTEIRETYERWIVDEDLLLQQGFTQFRQKKALEQANIAGTDEGKIALWLGDDLPPVHVYRAPYDLSRSDLDEADFDAEVWKEIVSLAEAQRARLKQAILTGVDDGRFPLEPVRRAWFQKLVDEFVPESHPESISSKFTDAVCNVFGHVCPVFFAAEAMTETREERRVGRANLDFTTMMRIVRRDDYRCQHCQKKLRDTEVEFDHIIPVSKGGSSEEHNLRLTCFDCNRDKGSDFDP